jgi:hypothetical protein
MIIYHKTVKEHSEAKEEKKARIGKERKRTLVSNRPYVQKLRAYLGPTASEVDDYLQCLNFKVQKIRASY